MQQNKCLYVNFHKTHKSIKSINAIYNDNNDLPNKK